MTPPYPAFETLLLHGSGLRALARGLLRDDHAAEDVVQETFVAALEQRAQSPERLGAWLAGVARNLALLRLRREARRAERERVTAASEVLAPPGPAAEHVLREVVDAVLELEEPYLGTIIARFFQDLPPREIARRQGVPVSTVKSRLGRALARLRERLDSADPEGRRRWAGALALVTGTGPGSGGAGARPGGPGGLSMEWKLCAAALAASAVALSTLRPVALTPSSAGQAPAGAAALARAGAPPAPPAAAPEAREDGSGSEDAALGGRAPVAPSGGAALLLPAAPAAPHEFALELTVVDANDRPVPGARVLLAPRLHPLNGVGETDAEGRLSVAWRGSEPSADVVLGVHAKASLTGLLALTVEAREPRELRLRLDPGGSVLLRRRLESVERGAAAALHEGRAPSSELKQELERRNADLSFDLAPVLAPLHAGAEAQVLDGLTELVWPLPSSARDQARTERVVSVLELHAAEHRRGLELKQVEALVRSAPRRELADLLLDVVVRDAEGRPVAGAPVSVTSAGRMVGFAETGPDGTCTLPVVETGAAAVATAGGGDLGLAATELVLDGARLAWEAVLDRGREARGRLLGPDGAPLAGFTVELVAGDRVLWHDATVSAGDGAFAIPNVDPRAERGRLLVRAPGAATPVPLRTFEWTGADAELRLAREDLGTGTLSLALLHDDGGDEGDEPEVVVWHEDSGRGFRLALRGDSDERFASPPLPPGRYSVVAGSAGRGYAPVATADVVADGDTDLGAVTLPSAARLALEGALALPEGAGPAAWTLVRRGDGWTSRVAAGTEPWSGSVPAGSYLLACEGPGFSAAPVAVEVAPGESAAVGLDFARLARVEIAVAGGRNARVTVSGGGVARAVVLGPGERVRTWVPAGTYAVRAEGAAGWSGERVVEVVAGERGEVVVGEE